MKFYILILSCLGLSATALALGSPNAKRGGNFKYNLTINPPTLNPLTAHDNYTVEVMGWMVETLLARDEDSYEWRPRLAESFEASEDLKTFSFNLRRGVRFHDGSEFTAEDVRFSLEVYGMKLYETTLEASAVRDIERIDVLGPYQVRIKMKTAVFDNLAALAGLPILPKKTYGDKSLVKRLNRNVLGSGPYRLKEFDPGSRMILEANPDWWGRALLENRYKYNFDSITVRFSSQEDATILMLEKGDLDYSPLKGAAFSKKTHGARWGKAVFAEHVRPADTFTTQTSLFVNLRMPLFQSVHLRRALQLLLNRKFVGEKMYDGLPIQATGPWHRLSEYADPNVKVVLFNEAEAIRLLREDGWADSDKDGVLDKVIGGKKTDLRFTMMIPKRDWETILTPYQHDLKKVGIEMEIKLVDWTLFTKNLDDLNFESYVVGRGYPGVVDFNPHGSWHSSEARKLGNNSIGYQNAEVDKLLDAAELEPVRAKRIVLIRKIYRKIAEDQAQLFWFSEPETYFARTSRVKMEKPNYRYKVGLDYWWIEP